MQRQLQPSRGGPCSTSGRGRGGGAPARVLRAVAAPTVGQQHTRQRSVACATAARAPIAEPTHQHTRRRSVACAIAATAPAAEAASTPQGSEVLPSASQPTQDAPFAYAVDRSYTKPSIGDSGTLRPAAEWFPAWMQYRRREDNYVFWQDKFVRCSLEIPWWEKRWTVFSSIWFLLMEFRFLSVPPAIRYVAYLGWRKVMSFLYEVHKAVVVLQAFADAWLASQATEGRVTGFSRAMVLRRLHWKNSLLGEMLYVLNVAKTGRVHMLPPEKRPAQRPTFLWFF